MLTRLTDMFVAVRRDTRELTAKKVRGHFRHFSQLIPKENVVNEFSLLLIFLAGGGGGGRGGGGRGTCYSGMYRISKILHCSHKTQATTAEKSQNSIHRGHVVLNLLF